MTENQMESFLKFRDIEENSSTWKTIVKDLL